MNAGMNGPWGHMVAGVDNTGWRQARPTASHPHQGQNRHNGPTCRQTGWFWSPIHLHHYRMCMTIGASPAASDGAPWPASEQLQSHWSWPPSSTTGLVGKPGCTSSETEVYMLHVP